jgi:hypothetical protein
MFYLVTAVAIVLATFSQYLAGIWQDLNSFALSAYLALLAMATTVGFNSSTLWKRFWLAYSLFGWSYFVYLLFVRMSGSYFERIVLGIPMGFACAFAVIAFTDDAVETKRDDDTTLARD